MRSAHRPVLLAVALAFLSLWACVSGGEGAWRVATADPADSLSSGIAAVEAGDFAQATTRLQWLAARCETGDYGRRAVLLLAALGIDPRNPDASSDEAARLAARYLGLPRIGPDDRVLAETLYLLALDRGAGIPAPPEEAEIRGTEAVRGVAVRFHGCGRQLPADEVALPELPGPTTTNRVSRLRAERDSLQDRLTSLEAELERIRELLGDVAPAEPDTSGW